MYKKRASVFYYRDYDFELVLVFLSFFSLFRMAKEKKGESIHYVNNINIAKRNGCRECVVRDFSLKAEDVQV